MKPTVKTGLISTVLFIGAFVFYNNSVHLLHQVPEELQISDDSATVGDDLTEALIQDEVVADEASDAVADRVVYTSGILDEDKYYPSVTTPLSNSTDPIRVALYVGVGTTLTSRTNTLKSLKCSKKKFKIHAMSAKGLNRLTVDNYDVVVFPGGSAGAIYRAIQKQKINPRMVVQKFVADGGGYVGFCAGAFLGTASQALNISPFTFKGAILGDGFISNTEIHPGFDLGPYNLPFTNEQLDGKKLFYANGPIFRPKIRKLKPNDMRINPRPILRIRENARLKIFVGRHGESETTKYQHRPIMVMSDYGKGHVILSTAHPETDVLKMTTWYRPTRASSCRSVFSRLERGLIFIAAARQRWD